MTDWRTVAASRRLKAAAAVLLVIVLMGVGVVVWRLQLPGTPSGAEGPADSSQLDTLHARCVQDMVANTCKVMGTGSTAVTAKPGELVFVAGIGAIDAVAYQQMYSAGDAMCSGVRDACAKQWDGPAGRRWGRGNSARRGSPRAAVPQGHRQPCPPAAAP